MTRNSTQRRVRQFGLVGVAIAAGLSVGVIADSAFAGNGTGNNDGTMNHGRSSTSGQQHGRSTAGSTNGSGNGSQQRSGDGTGCLTTGVVVPASATLADVLTTAVAEERLAVTTYQMVIDRFGDVAPFSNIVESEATHVEALEQLAERYGVDVENIVVIPPPTPTTLAAAYELGVQVELEDGALYDELVATLASAGETADYPDVIRVFANLQRASLEHHLPAFESALG